MRSIQAITRRKRLAVIGAIVLIAVVWPWARPTDRGFFDFVVRHPALSRIVRPLFQIAGRDDKFMLGLLKAYQRLQQEQLRIEQEIRDRYYSGFDPSRISTGNEQSRTLMHPAHRAE